jgi:hypothetical protein
MGQRERAGPEAAMDDQQQEIRERAHSISEQEGRPDGRDRAHWDRAERELRSEQGSPGDAATSTRTEQAPTSSVGSASGLSPSGTTTGGGPGAGQGSIGTGGGSTGGSATGSPSRVGK